MSGNSTHGSLVLDNLVEHNPSMSDQVALALIPAVVTVLIALIALGEQISRSRPAKPLPS